MRCVGSGSEQRSPRRYCLDVVLPLPLDDAGQRYTLLVEAARNERCLLLGRPAVGWLLCGCVGSAPSGHGDGTRTVMLLVLLAWPPVCRVGWGGLGRSCGRDDGAAASPGTPLSQPVAQHLDRTVPVRVEPTASAAHTYSDHGAPAAQQPGHGEATCPIRSMRYGSSAGVQSGSGAAHEAVTAALLNAQHALGRPALRSPGTP